MTESATESGYKCKVLVVGAGVAGLATAYELTKTGHDVMVLESSMRPGGRIRTMRHPFADGLYADMGASFFADSDPYVMQYAREFDLPLMVDPVRTDNKNYFLSQRWIVTDHGVPLDVPGLTAEERKGGLDFLFFNYLIKGVLEPQAGKPPLHPLQAGWPPAPLQQYDGMTARQFLESRGASPAAIKVLELGVFGLNGEGLATYSALSLLAIVTLALLAKCSFWFIGGSDLLPKAFASRLSGRIRYSTKVLTVETRATGVVVHAEVPGGRTVDFHADQVVFAVPLGALKHIAFTPQLSAGKQDTLKLRRMSVTRAFLQVRERFWEDEAPDGIVLTDKIHAVLIASCPLHHTSRGIIEAYTGGAQARAIDAMTPAQQVDFAMAQVGEVFPEAADYFEGGAVVSWDHDASARGAAAWFEPGQLLKSLPHLGASEDRIHFAGDESTPMPGWTQSALFSGIRAAANVRNALAGK